MARYDACSKRAITAALAFGERMTPRDIASAVRFIIDGDDSF
jgi:hypothetical protein